MNNEFSNPLRQETTIAVHPLPVDEKWQRRQTRRTTADLRHLVSSDEERIMNWQAFQTGERHAGHPIVQRLTKVELHVDQSWPVEKLRDFVDLQRQQFHGSGQNDGWREFKTDEMTKRRQADVDKGRISKV